MSRSGKNWVVGLTGGVGSGKTTVAALFRRRGWVVLDADAEVRRLLSPGGAAVRPVARRLGPTVVARDGGVDRKKIADRVFQDPALRRTLEKILHPLVRRAFLAELRRQKGRNVLLDVPLLFESGWDRWVDRTVTVWAPRRLRWARLARSGRLTPADARRREKAQMPLREKMKRSDFVLKNSGSHADLSRAVTRLQTAFASPKKPR